jgi:hypothetical protein
MDFKSILSNKNEEIDNSLKYKCNHCSKVKEGKPWSKHLCESSGKKTYICSYLCYKAYRPQYKNMWEDLVNKEDFDHIYPYKHVHHQKKEEFVFLSRDILDAMSNEEYELYMESREEYYTFNPFKAEIEENMVKDDDYVNTLTKSTSFSSDDSINGDDY